LGICRYTVFSNFLGVSMMIKERVIVMNGSRLLEKEDDANKWKVAKVEDAGALRAGIYNIHNAVKADKKTQSDGQILHVDREFVYQMVSKDRFVKHDIKDFDKAPTVGSSVKVEYAQNAKASFTNSGAKKSRSR